MSLQRIRIIGSGLIGTSIGLAAVARGLQVEMVDSDPRSQSIAQNLVQSKALEAPAQLVLIAVPISAFTEVMEREFALNLEASFIDVLSVKVKPVIEAEALKIPLQRYLPTHPMAGREIGGAESARADLFIDRPWIIDPAGVDSKTLELGQELIALCGAIIYQLPIAEHDRAVALISHLPQITASLLASQLLASQGQWLELAGGGLRDTTRIAASDANLWREIITSNSAALKPLLISMRDQINTLIGNLDNLKAVENFLILGNKGRSLIPGKHGGVARNYTYLPVIIEDKPGQLAALFDECDLAGVNVEDISIEHSPGQFTGLVMLALSNSDAILLQQHLNDKGWTVHSPRGEK